MDRRIIEPSGLFFRSGFSSGPSASGADPLETAAQQDEQVGKKKRSRESHGFFL